MQIISLASKRNKKYPTSVEFDKRSDNDMCSLKRKKFATLECQHGSAQLSDFYICYHLEPVASDTTIVTRELCPRASVAKTSRAKIKAVYAGRGETLRRFAGRA